MPHVFISSLFSSTFRCRLSHSLSPLLYMYFTYNFYRSFCLFNCLLFSPLFPIFHLDFCPIYRIYIIYLLYYYYYYYYKTDALTVSRKRVSLTLCIIIIIYFYIPIMSGRITMNKTMYS